MTIRAVQRILHQTKIIWISVSCCLLSLLSHAQTDSLSLTQKLLQENQTSKVREKLSKVRQALTLEKPPVNFKLSPDTLKGDSTIRRITQKKDSLGALAHHKIDSIKSIGAGIISKPAQLQNNIENRINRPVQII